MIGEHWLYLSLTAINSVICGVIFIRLIILRLTNSIINPEDRIGCYIIIIYFFHELCDDILSCAMNENWNNIIRHSLVLGVGLCYKSINLYPELKSKDVKSKEVEL